MGDSGIFVIWPIFSNGLVRLLYRKIVYEIRILGLFSPELAGHLADYLADLLADLDASAG